VNDSEKIPACYFENAGLISAVFGKEDLSDLPLTTNDAERRILEKKFIAEYFSLNESSVLFLKQTHSDIFHFITEDEKLSDSVYYAEGDAFYTQRKNTALCIRTADCLPVVFYAETDQKRTAGIIHAGWRGLEKKIITKVINDVKNRLSLDESSIRFFSGPCIGPDSYQVQSDVADLFAVKTPNSDGSWMLDLAGNAKLETGNLALEFAGCTYKDSGRFFSHRNGDIGRNLNVIILKD